MERRAILAHIISPIDHRVIVRYREIQRCPDFFLRTAMRICCPGQIQLFCRHLARILRLVPWQLWTIMPAVRLCETVILQLLPLRVNKNSLIFSFELVVAKCFYLSRNLFPSFSYGKRKCVFAVIWPYTWYMKVKIWGISGIVWVNIRHLYKVVLKHFRDIGFILWGPCLRIGNNGTGAQDEITCFRIL